MYSERRSTWLRLGASIADFHAGTIGDPALGRTEEKVARTRDRVEKRLAQLADGHPGLPMVIFTDGPSTRTIWPGLQVHPGVKLAPAPALDVEGDSAVSGEAVEGAHRQCGAACLRVAV